MSVTTQIVCDKCKVSCWVGQRNVLYGHQYIPDFLAEHKGHILRFVDEHMMCDDEFADYKKYDKEDCDEMQYPTLERLKTAKATLKAIGVLASDYSDIFGSDMCCITPDDITKIIDDGALAAAVSGSTPPSNR